MPPYSIPGVTLPTGGNPPTVQTDVAFTPRVDPTPNPVYLQTSTLGCATGEAQWQFLSWPSEDRPVLDIAGNAAMLQPYPAGTLINQWADPNLATAWMTYARYVMNNPIPASALNPSLEWSWILAIFKAITSAYNALNIPIFTDPVVRASYRRHFCGMPKASGVRGGSIPSSPNATDTASLYDQSLYVYSADYRNDWYSLGGVSAIPPDGDDRPLIGANVQETGFVGGIDPTTSSRVGNSAFGDIVAASIQSQRRYGDNGLQLQFVFSALPLLVQPCGAAPPLAGPPDFSNDGLSNGYMARNRYFFEATLSDDGRAGEPFTHFDGTVGQGGSNQNHGFYGFPQDRAIMPDGTQLPQFSDNWQATYFDVPGILGGRAQIAAGFQYYMSFIYEIVNGFLNRTSQQIIQDARSFTLYSNAKMYQANHGTSFLTTIFQNMGQTIANQQNADKASIMAAAQMIGVAGAALAGPTLGISAVIGGVISAVTAIGGQFFQASVSGFGKDDLGRLKPYFETAWLNGDCDDPSSPPTALRVDQPPGVGSSRFTINSPAPLLHGHAGITPAVSVAVSQAPVPYSAPVPVPSSVSTGTAVAVLAAVGAGVWWMKGKKKTETESVRKNPRRAQKPMRGRGNNQ